MTTEKAKSIVHSTKTSNELISLKEQVADLVPVVKSNQNQISYNGNEEEPPD